MNTTRFKTSGFHGRRRTRPSAYTLVELMIAMTIMLMALVGVLAVQAFGMRLFELTRSKLGASDDARKAIDLLCTEIRSAKIIRIGTGGLGLTNFADCAPGALQSGSALQIYASTNTNSFVRYYWNSATNQLERTPNGNSAFTVVANFITNSAIFSAEDAFGNILTNSRNNRVISLKLRFYQMQYPIVRIGAGNYYDFYQLSTKTTRRALE
jgi:type II secretory pathway pseudopilin PulG